VEALADAEIAEVAQSAQGWADTQSKTRPLDRFLVLLHAFDWLNIRGKEDEAALHAFFGSQFGDPLVIAEGGALSGSGEAAGRFRALLERARALAEEERFLNWQVSFPGVWSGLETARPEGGFDAVIGNPPWERMRLEQVQWFAERRPEIARAPRAADRRRMVAGLREAADPLAAEYKAARARAEAAIRTARTGGDYPLLSSGDTNLYSLFVERAMALAKPDGMVGLLVPSGIASDSTAAPFFRSVATEGRLKAFYDFENRKNFFPDVHASFKFCVFAASPATTGQAARYAVFLHDLSGIEDPDRCFPLSAADFARVNPNTGTAPIFRSRRDAELTTAIYSRLPVLADRSSGAERKAWPVKYSTMFHMTNDSHLFRTREELEEKEGAWPIAGNRFDSPSGLWTPLYVGRMIHQFDHRAASVELNPDNLQNPYLSAPTLPEEKRDPFFTPTPPYWVRSDETPVRENMQWTIGFRDITNPTNARSMIAALIPRAGAGNTLPLLSLEEAPAESATLLLANLNAVPFDFVARQKIQGQHLNWFILEQLPVVPPERYETALFGPKTAGEIVREAVLELTYTAHDMAPFARGMGHVDAAGAALPPFRWDEKRRLLLRAKLDALYFHLYGVTDRDDIRYIYATFPIVERRERRAWGGYRSRDLCLAWTSALAAGQPDAEIDL